ncbi:MAG TPA: molecular chaperone Hsp90 [Candidatus Blautia excrementipullorum]|nr:molecular chaperone Hsp90 [Candidatus Blautia excrementipullorum]
MTKEVQQYVIEKSKELMAAASCCQGAKEAAQRWIDAAGTDREAEETRKYIEELEADIVTVDGLISFAESEMGAKVFGGEEKAKGVAAHGREIKAAGAKYCDCPACTVVEAILARKDEMMA